MIPLRTILVNAKGIKAGIGLDRITIDFDSLIPNDAVTVAIRGDNGSGKTTLMNLGMTPHLNPPQIKGRMFDEFEGDGERHLEWGHEGKIYRTLIQYKQGKQAKTSAYLYELDKSEERYVSVKLPDGIVSDGKTSTYNACLEHILGPQSIYYLSAFRAQSAPMLSEYESPETLMEDLLGLADIRNLAIGANDVRKAATNDYAAVSDRAGQIGDEIERQKELLEDLDTARKESPGLLLAHQDANANQVLANESYKQAVAGDLDREKAIVARRKVEARITEFESKAKADTKEIEGDIERMVKRREHEHATSKLARKNSNDAIKYEESSIDKNKDILKQSGEINTAVKELPMALETIKGIEEDEAKLQAKVQAKAAAKLASTEISFTIDIAREQLKDLRKGYQEMERRANFVSEVPCKGVGEYAKCPALEDAIQDRKDLKEASDAIEEKISSLKEPEARLSNAQEAFNEYGDPSSELKTIKRTLDSWRNQVLKMQSLASLAPMLATAQSDIAHSWQQIDKIKATQEGHDSDLRVILKEFHTEIDQLNARRENVHLLAHQSITLFSAELAALPAIKDDNVRSHAARTLREADAAALKAAADLENNTHKIAQLKAIIDTAQADIEAGKSIVKQALLLETEIKKWSLLTKALSGVIKLIIEDAGPTIAAMANKLLDSAYGPRFTVRIVSLKELQNGNTVECFDISVIDSKTGMESSIIHKSKGESVWLDKALTDAFGLYHQQASGRKYGALFADEVDDGLTAERKHQLYEMDRAMLGIGGYQRKFFVSHNPDAWDYADYVINLEDYSK